MTWTIGSILTGLTGLLLLVEQRGYRTTLRLSFKGDVKRESAFLSQYGQAVATPLGGWLAAIARGNDWRIFVLICAPVLITSMICILLKRLLGRVRPTREQAGRFTGFSLRRESGRESFPSSHSACAAALSVGLVHVWPEAAIVFWLLAGVTAALRYVMDAHFPSDVTAGLLLGLVVGNVAVASIERLILPV